MKISEMIEVLQAELDKRGDVEVVLQGMYGADETTFEVQPDHNLSKEMVRSGNLFIWTGINTG